MASGQRTKDNGHGTGYNAQWTVDRGHWTRETRQWTTDLKQVQKTMDMGDTGQRTGDMETLNTVHIAGTEYMGRVRRDT